MLNDRRVKDLLIVMQIVRPRRDFFVHVSSGHQLLSCAFLDVQVLNCFCHYALVELLIGLIWIHRDAMYLASRLLVCTWFVCHGF